MKRVIVVLAAVALTACSDRGEARHYGLGHTPAAAEVARVDVDAGPDGEGLPPGRGSAADGAAIYTQKCASCHGDRGQGQRPLYPALVGRDTSDVHFAFGSTPGLTRTIGNYWPYATTVFDYVRRAMPQTAPGSLTNDEVYALTAFLLASNLVIPSDAVLDSASLARVTMPYVNRFVKDDRRGGKEIK